MNNQTRRIYLLIFNNSALIVTTNLSSFYQQILDLDIGYSSSYSTLRNQFKESNSLTFNQGSRVYWLQKVENND